MCGGEAVVGIKFICHHGGGGSVGLKSKIAGGKGSCKKTSRLTLTAFVCSVALRSSQQLWSCRDGQFA